MQRLITVRADHVWLSINSDIKLVYFQKWDFLFHRKPCHTNEQSIFVKQIEDNVQRAGPY